MITLPIPPTDNRRLTWNRRKTRLISHPSYRRWVAVASRKWNSDYEGKFELINPDFKSQVSIDYKLYLPDKRCDIQNFGKALNDFLKGRIFKDDHWVKLNLILPVEVDRDNPRVEILNESNNKK